MTCIGPQAYGEGSTCFGSSAEVFWKLGSNLCRRLAIVWLPESFRAQSVRSLRSYAARAKGLSWGDPNDDGVGTNVEYVRSLLEDEGIAPVRECLPT